MYLKICFAILLVGYAAGKTHFKYCGGTSVTLDITNFPDVIHVKKDHKLHLNFNVAVTKVLPATVYLKIKMSRKVGWFVWVPLPCIKDVGSCEYEVTCDFLKKHSPGGVLPHPCPAPVGTTTRDITIKFPAIPWAVKKVGSGTYYLEARVYTKPGKSGEMLACAEAEVTVET